MNFVLFKCFDMGLWLCVRSLENVLTRILDTTVASHVCLIGDELEYVCVCECTQCMLVCMYVCTHV